MMRKSYNGIDKISFGANVKQFTQDNAKNNIMLVFLSVNSAAEMFLLSCQIITSNNYST